MVLQKSEKSLILMFNIVTILPFGIDVKTKEIKVLLNQDYIFISKSKDTASNFSAFSEELLFQHVKINPEWVKFFLVDVIQLEDSLGANIIYTCLIPETIELINSKWVSIQNISGDNKNVLKLAIKKVWQ